MRKRVILPPGLLKQRSGTFVFELRSLAVQVMQGITSKDQAKNRGKELFARELEDLLQVTWQELDTMMPKVGSMPPEEKARLERWRDEEYARFAAAIDDL